MPALLGTHRVLRCPGRGRQLCLGTGTALKGSWGALPHPLSVLLTNTLGTHCSPQAPWGHSGGALCPPALWGTLGLPSAPRSHAGVPHAPWPCAAPTAHTAQLHCTSGMGTQMGHPARHRKGQTRAPCFGLGSLSPQLFIFTQCTTIPVFTRLYLLYCVSWSCMYQCCPWPRRGHAVQPEPKCQRLKKCLNKPHICTDTAPPCCHRLMPGWCHVPMGLVGKGRALDLQHGGLTLAWPGSGTHIHGCILPSQSPARPVRLQQDHGPRSAMLSCMPGSAARLSVFPYMQTQLWKTSPHVHTAGPTWHRQPLPILLPSLR